jgi:hypothetical protein
MRVEDNLRVFDELVALFRARTPVPRDVPIATDPLDWGFPPSLAAGLERALDDRRIAAIRREYRRRHEYLRRLRRPLE